MTSGRHSRLAISGLFPTAIWLLAGCHTFAPASIGAVSPGEIVRARVTGSFSDSLAQVLDGDPRELEGTVVEGTPDVIVIDVAVAKGFRGMRPLDLSQRIRLAASDILSLESKRVARVRSALTVGGLAAALGIFVARELSGDRGGSQHPGVTDPIERRIGFPVLLRVVAWPP